MNELTLQHGEHDQKSHGRRKLKATRLSAGNYEIKTEKGTYRVERNVLDLEEWFVYWPGQLAADEVTFSLKDAKNLIADDLKND